MRGIQVSHRATAKAYNLAAEDNQDGEMWLEKLHRASKPNGTTSQRLDDEEPSFTSGSSQPLPPTPMSRAPSLSFPPSAGSTPSQREVPKVPVLPRYENVPAPYPELLETSFKEIESLTNTKLPTVEGQTNGPWKFLFSKKGVLAATKSGPNVTVRGDSTMPYPPLAVLNTVINIYKKSLYDNQFDVGKRLITYNHHTFVDYLRFKAVWPTSTRDLCNIVTWKVDNGRIVLVAKAFKDELVCPKVKGNVRAEAVTAGWVISEVKLDDGSRGSRVHIVVCSDLKGSLPGNIKSLVTQQQAMFPVIIGRWMKDNENTEDKRFDVRVEERTVIEGVIKKLPNDLRVGVKKPPPTGAEIKGVKLDPQNNPRITNPTPTPSRSPPDGTTTRLSTSLLNSALGRSSPTPAFTPSTNSNNNKGSSYGVVYECKGKVIGKPTVMFTSIALFLPVILWTVSKYYLPEPVSSSRGFLFLLGLIVGLRTFATRRLGRPMSYADGSTVGLCGNGNGGMGEVKAKFNVDLKKILRYIQKEKGGNKRPGTKGKANEDGSIAVTHIALKALALTLREMPIFNGRRVNLPLIGVSGWYPNAGVDVSTTAGRPENGVKGIVKLRDADGMGVKDISREIAVRANGRKEGWGGDAAVPGFLKKPMEVLSEQLDLPVKGLGLGGRKFGSALVITSPNNDGSEVDMTVSPIRRAPGSGSGPNIILVVGGVQILPSFSKEPRSAIARPVLSISVTFDVEVANVATCRMFAEKLQNRMRNPELLEE
ncbi:hypothetical protein TrCOL_g6126 [Triparma columacea]|uniref:PH domain-containing protein n=1 Tax=Triparma columacea TaxID=722753 RepID=A0A9W7L700_9STRA|nr:hypothetical protein TrCOL_g6126 [Triparma columacea]